MISLLELGSIPLKAFILLSYECFRCNDNEQEKTSQARPIIVIVRISRFIQSYKPQGLTSLRNLKADILWEGASFLWHCTPFRVRSWCVRSDSIASTPSTGRRADFSLTCLQDVYQFTRPSGSVCKSLSFCSLLSIVLSAVRHI